MLKNGPVDAALIDLLLEEHSGDEIKKFSLIAIKLLSNPLFTREKLENFEEIRLHFFQQSTKYLTIQDYQKLIDMLNNPSTLYATTGSINAKQPLLPAYASYQFQVQPNLSRSVNAPKKPRPTQKKNSFCCPFF